jgi:hypothetical protein
MTDAERERIAKEVRADAELENRVANLETEQKKMAGSISWGIKAIWGGVAYLAVRLFDFLANGGALK